jgi:hypothetical protein
MERWCPMAGRHPSQGRRGPAAPQPPPAPVCRSRRPGPRARRGPKRSTPRRRQRGRQKAARRAEALPWEARHATTRRVGRRSPAQRASRTAGRCARGTPPEAARYRPCPEPLGRCAQWRAAPGLPPARAPRSHPSPPRPPARQTRCRHARPHARHTRSTTPAAAHGWYRSGPHTLAKRASHTRDSGGEDRTGFPHPERGLLVPQRVGTRRHYTLKMSLIHHSN